MANAPTRIKYPYLAKSSPSRFVTRIIELIEENIEDEAYGIAQLCRDCGASRTQIHRKLKEWTGLSTAIFIRNIRLRTGKKILLNSNLNVSEVAYEVGFKDYRYFSRLFTAYYGINPRDIRKSHFMPLEVKNHRKEVFFN